MKRFPVVVYFFAFLALSGFVGWNVIAASKQHSITAERQKRLAITATNVSTPPGTQDPDDSFRIYAVNVVHTPPLKNPFIGYGIYLGDGKIITAAHVVGHWPFFTNMRVFIAGLDLPAEVIKKGSLDDTDLALLSVDPARLPVSLLLRRNHLCAQPPIPGTNVVVATPEKIIRSRIISPELIAPQYRARFDTLVDDLGNSGSGVFNAAKKCLFGIMSRRIVKYAYREENGSIVRQPNGVAGYFVPVFDFTPPEFRF